MKSLLTATLLLFFTTSIIAQELVPGELIIQLKKGTDSESFFNQLSQNRALSNSIDEVTSVVPNLQLFLYKFDERVAEANFLIEQISAYEAVNIVAQNLKFEPRDKTPNDLLYDQQWGLEAIGAPEVWECTTGGTTLLGDTIVVANLESCDIHHEDIQGNIWINHGEIPNDSFDNDGNTFIDDYYGWNTTSQNDNHDFNNLHGTQTAGIIGARGDNDIGISGVNWNVKVMVVSNNLQFDQIIESYWYVLKQRRLYNKTNGEKGAFVVATNASFGASGFPGDNELFTIWCQTYDSLGVQGILSAGATNNSKINIDDIGDMPTSCPSDYLIAVTDVDQSNALRGGFSEVNIDLGAPGSTSQALSPNNGYVPVGGTSAATPHVSGGIALLYSLPCEEFVQLAHDEPAEAALKMKKYIMDGATPLTELEGVTVTGGLLNLKNAMDHMQDDCGSPTGKMDFLSIYPNPVREILTVDYQTPDNTKYDIRVYDAIGQLVHYLSVEPVKFEGKTFTLDVSSWASGVYFISIENISNIVSARFVVAGGER